MQIKYDIWLKIWDEDTGEVMKCVSENSFMEISDAAEIESIKPSLIDSCKVMEAIIKGL